MDQKSLLLRRLPQSAAERLRRLRDRAVSFRYSRDLIRLGEHFGSDKWGSHWYLQHYQTHFAPIRKKRLNLLEIGVGGYADPNLGGNSLRTWKAYFPHANIFGIDIYDKRKIEEKRIKIFQGSQVDEVFLRDVIGRMGGVDIVIDDGSHLNTHVVQTFGILFSLLRNPGIYVVEDTQTSYWPGFGGSSRDLNDPSTIMGHFTSMAHCLNHEEILREECAPTEFDRHIVAMHFYHNLIFISKGDNSEGSNVLRNNRSDSRIVHEGIDCAPSENEAVKR